MTKEELKIYRLEARALLLERVFSSVSIGLLVGQGATISQAREELTHALEREGNKIQAELPSLSKGDPAQNALLQEEFREIVDGLKSLIKSYN